MMMEDLTSKPAVRRYFAPQMTQYGIKLPCRVAVVGQMDSGKTHSIMHSWLGGNISFWRPNLLDGSPRNASLQHEMKGGDLMKNLQWLGRFGRLRTLLDDEVNDDNNNDDDNDEDAVQQSDLIGGGGSPRKHQCRNDSSYKFEGERNIRRAMPEMEGTLGNWTLHGQNLGTMLKNYKRQYRHQPPNHKRELGQFFNTTSTVLDTIGSMMENAILLLVQFDSGGNNHDGGLTGRGMDSAPQPKLPATKYNL